ncbi:hypothetical protein [Bacillus cereus]|uniref:hypothetical protein n=1 Tax=Bacillus cereus TaxID=1396 RepID=UPI0005DE44A4|nr:hypothetical protein [Bacillus cereus]MDF9488797.1 hypothetical protein [Bacillus cereus]COF21717.1 Uncharacterised protein [Streptococcus pneumoniae]
MEIETLIETFQKNLDDHSISSQEFVKRYITHGTPYVFDGDQEMYFEVKKVISSHFEIEPEDVMMVGSGKLGFSLNTDQLWKPIDDESDLDMVIISDKVFDKYWRELYEFNVKLTSRTANEEKRYKKFLDYFLKGWLRPDYFPQGFMRTQEWFDFFLKTISYKKEYGRRKITGAVYKDRFFYEKYHMNNIENIRLERLIKK